MAKSNLPGVQFRGLGRRCLAMIRRDKQIGLPRHGAGDVEGIHRSHRAGFQNLNAQAAPYLGRQVDDDGVPIQLPEQGSAQLAGIADGSGFSRGADGSMRRRLPGRIEMQRQSSATPRNKAPEPAGSLFPRQTAWRTRRNQGRVSRLRSWRMADANSAPRACKRKAGFFQEGCAPPAGEIRAMGRP